MHISTFLRYEKKYLITKKQMEKLIQRIESRLDYDSHCIDRATYNISTLYFDSEDNDIIRQSIAHPKYKEKLRMRCYGMPKSEDDKVFLELKKKVNGVVSKRRAIMKYREAKLFLDKGIKPNSNEFINNQILDEITYHITTKKVMPKIFITYQRLALVAKDDNERGLRITFDTQLKTRRYGLNFDKEISGSDMLSSNKVLMEIKFLAAIPYWLTRILSELDIKPHNYSKYGEEYKQYIQNYIKQEQRSEKIC